jgi:hypothetical protein
MYTRLEDIQTDLQTFRKKGLQRGYSIGWDWDMLPLTIKLGCTTYMGSAPVSGKSELIKEIQINLSCLHNLNHVIFTPETGDPKEIFAELCHSYIGKPYLEGKNSMTISECAQAEYFINEHFVIIDPVDADLTMTELYDMVNGIEDDLGKKIHTTLIDPWNELSEEYITADLGREDKYLSRILGKARKNARATNRHHFIITHVRDQNMVSVGEVRYFPAPHAREFAGGQVWYRKGLLMIIPWRPPFGLSGDDNIQYEKNELHLKIVKAKPKGVSRTGTFKLYLDTDKYQYYMLHPFDKKRVYADRKEGAPKPVEIEPTIDFETNTNDNGKDDLPF